MLGFYRNIYLNIKFERIIPYFTLLHVLIFFVSSRFFDIPYTHVYTLVFYTFLYISILLCLPSFSRTILSSKLSPLFRPASNLYSQGRNLSSSAVRCPLLDIGLSKLISFDSIPRLQIPVCSCCPFDVNSFHPAWQCDLPTSISVSLSVSYHMLLFFAEFPRCKYGPKD